MTLLQIIQRAFSRCGLSSPASAFGSTDENVVRMIELANEEGEQLALRHHWQAMTREATHTTLAAESQGLITTICGSDFDYIKNDTFWNRTQDRKWHPADDAEWQRMKSNGITGPDTWFRIRGNYLLAQPVPTAGQTLAFEWMTTNWCESIGGTGQETWAADTDVPRLPGRIMLQGLIWRWKKSQGLEYAEDFDQYESMVANAKTRDGAKKRINMGGGTAAGRNVPEGSWTL